VADTSRSAVLVFTFFSMSLSVCGNCITLWDTVVKLFIMLHIPCQKTRNRANLYTLDYAAARPIQVTPLALKTKPNHFIREKGMKYPKSRAGSHLGSASKGLLEQPRLAPRRTPICFNWSESSHRPPRPDPVARKAVCKIQNSLKGAFSRGISRM
jgi:hypothetical protein